MQLPGLPTTKARVIERAASEGWPFEEQKGRGGTRRLYEIPEKYLAGTSYAAPEIAKTVAGTIAAGSADVDLRLLTLAVRALDEWEQERGVKVSSERRAVVLNFLYDYLRKGGNEGVLDEFLKAVG